MDRACIVVVDGDPEAGVIRCGDRASYEAERWGVVSDAMPLCSHHAWHALDDGAEVTGPFGHLCKIDDDGEIREMLQ